MGYIFDIILVAIAVICIVCGAKLGFFKSLMNLVTGVLALIIAFTFTPMLSDYINDNYVIDSVSDSIETTLLSIAESEEGKDGYDIELLFKDSQVMSLMEGAGVSQDAVEEAFYSAEVNAKGYIAGLAYTVAAPIAKTVSDILAFIILFIVAYVILKIVTLIIGIFLKLPVLKNLDKGLGVVFGIISAIFFVLVISMMAGHLVEALAVVAPGNFNTDILDNSILLGLLAKYNPVSALAGVLIG
ncbi:MAG: CvpA family protein [Ruminococcaceae bacterium]|nr:CvpA family protein [Oscillospiraceae bacterium]